MGAFFIVDNLVTRQLPWEWHVMAHVIPIQDSLGRKKDDKFCFLDEFPVVWFRSLSFHSAQLWRCRNKTWLRPWTRDRSLHRWIPSYRHTKLDCEMRPGTIWDLRCGSRRNWHTMMVYYDGIWVCLKYHKHINLNGSFANTVAMWPLVIGFEHRKTQKTKQRKNQQQWTMN